MKKQPVIFSIGHGAKALDLFLQKLTEHDIEILIDVRTHPYSRFFPHFSQNALIIGLASQNIKYLFKGASLGGRGVNKGYEEAIREVVDMAYKGIRVAVLCAEADYHKCHRYTVLTPDFEKLGARVVHIEYEKKLAKHNK